MAWTCRLRRFLPRLALLADQNRSRGAAGRVPQCHLSFKDRVDQAIDFELPDQQGATWRLAEFLSRGPVVLVFYRGDW
ncbi:MAG: redoxin domain-containing protein [Chloroflexi bacterium]|nr:MAG: hypothetical protein DMD97_04790 [Candidatus Rokubacteria bacterium]TMF68241.1 MAG: redoxin domain-containing protein [Chloroflexota bacterium]TMF86805.1 MAG: redoxin domain-containing protein [Chloroflexota bacterium]TMG09927.1 MAG: redoxin domain-containing protein [Chloroflexota bacterium]